MSLGECSVESTDYALSYGQRLITDGRTVRLHPPPRPGKIRFLEPGKKPGSELEKHVRWRREQGLVVGRARLGFLAGASICKAGAVASIERKKVHHLLPC